MNNTFDILPSLDVWPEREELKTMTCKIKDEPPQADSSEAILKVGR